MKDLEVNLLFGKGVNDADYPVYMYKDRKQIVCPFYKRWYGMFTRCYSTKYHERQPAYRGCYVHEDWYSFMNFKRWMELQDWEGNHLDKDILIEGNRLYSSDTCVFVDKKTNSFCTTSKVRTNGLPTGVYRVGGVYRAKCGNGCGVSVELGCHSTIEEARVAVVTYKYSIAVQIASRQKNPLVAEKILEMFKIK